MAAQVQASAAASPTLNVGNPRRRCGIHRAGRVHIQDLCALLPWADQGDHRKRYSRRGEILEAAEPWLQVNPIQVECYQEGGPYEISQDHPLVKTAASFLPEGKIITASPAGNDARLLQNIAGIPTIVLGPGNQNRPTASMNPYLWKTT